MVKIWVIKERNKEIYERLGKGAQKINYDDYGKIYEPDSVFIDGREVEYYKVENIDGSLYIIVLGEVPKIMESNIQNRILSSVMKNPSEEPSIKIIFSGANYISKYCT